MKRVLILGGTEDAAALAALCRGTPGLLPIVSLAGRTARPILPDVPTRIGGFDGVAGMAAYLAGERINALVDATHPFAARISANAAEAARIAGVPRLLLQRPVWSPGAGDDWRRVPDPQTAAGQLPPNSRVFLALGAQRLEPFGGRTDVWFLVRTVDPLEMPPLPGPHACLTGRGPFVLDDEIALLETHAITHLVSRNSGGTGARAKLDAARRLGLPVIMIERPAPEAGDFVADASTALDWLQTTMA